MNHTFKEGDIVKLVDYNKYYKFRVSNHWKSANKVMINNYPLEKRPLGKIIEVLDNCVRVTGESRWIETTLYNPEKLLLIRTINKRKLYR